MVVTLAACSLWATPTLAQPAGELEASPAAAATPPKPRPSRFDIDEFEIQGADKLKQIDVEEAVYPFLGPNRSAADVEKARAALEKAYHDRGFQTVGVAVPDQDPERRVIVLKVTEQRIGQVRVNGSRYFDLNHIRDNAPAVAEGKLPNFNEISKDIVRLNQLPDRRVTPALRAGATPGTVDIDLNVEDKFPLHASVELNNRNSPNTKDLRLVSTIHYDNLWQLGHSLNVSYQMAPQARDQVEVWSGSYLWRPYDEDRVNILVYGVDSKSSVATVGGINVVGPGQIIGTRAIATLPGLDGFFHTVSAGVDYKHFDQSVELDAASSSTPVTYYPLSINYNATWQGEGSLTQFGAGLIHGVRGLGSDPLDFDNKRYKATGNFSVLKADLSQTVELPHGFQLFGKAQGQASDQPLVSSEQFSVGGLDTVRGYLESETVGDYGAAGTIELRSPDLVALFRDTFKPETPADGPQIQLFNEMRLFAFGDRGVTAIYEPLPEQDDKFDLASYGFGTRFRALDYFNGQVAYAIPLIEQASTKANHARVLFRFWGEF
ncbi:ShlB/FhaC/HecB family hemolysin secretion/activation protein [Blastochloris viridis]|uniref:Hemolysin activation/secretion protein associated with VreARI signalling system n=1 Tax=Blastochloris viridis TaxID=1079 RepID=A0A0H5BE43_BLAVI|nr:ShlB/FhaC/HecB family hemolysin secretion/activation protein [Blastochloris viridis]ALK09643.1 POTRA domain, ShlB-type [Blastochloris viridis]BAS00468.1 hemolysin activation/secretion protein associated with VreARI signalling system [Blastochloris viridis]CUU42306.1 Outer membrane protein/protective antigen OMA87 [Blastochloris viridis]